MKNDLVKLYQGDCLKEMDKIKSGSIDMVLTDPPYGTTACKWDSIIPLPKMWLELKRITKLKSAIIFTASQPFTSALIMSNITNFKYCWVWDKKSASNFHSAKYQPLKTHEDIVVFNGKYKPQMTIGKERKKGGKNKPSGEAACSLKPLYHSNNKYYPKSILNIKTERGLHPTQKPVALMEYLIKTYTNENDTVLDFTMGSGTTGVACISLNRKFIGIELDKKYFQIAKKRIYNEINRETF